jgi:transglutaminase-like putative cysteine protease
MISVKTQFSACAAHQRHPKDSSCPSAARSAGVDKRGGRPFRLRREFILDRVGCYGLAIGLWLACADRGVAELVYRNPRPFNVTYTFELQPDAAKIDRTKDLKLWLPLPREWESQKAVKILSITPKPDATWEDPDFGNRMACWDFGRGPEKPVYQAQIRFRIEAYNVEADVDPAKVGAYDKSSAEYRLYTRSERTICITPQVRELAKEAVGDETNPYLQARRIAQFAYRKVHFKILDFVRGRGIQCLLDYPEKDPKTGERYYEGCCNQRSALAVAMCRAVGIPARCVDGFVGWRPWLPINQARYPFETNLLSGKLAGAQYFGWSSAHMWTEFYIPDYGWIPDDYAGLPCNEVLIRCKGRDIKIGPERPPEGGEGYGAQWVLLEGGRVDDFGYGVWNIAKIRTARVKLAIEPDPFPAEEFAEYESLLWPATNSESRIKAARTSALATVYQATRNQRDTRAVLAADFKRTNHKYKCGVVLLDMLRKQVGDKNFSGIYQDFLDVRLRSQAPVATAQFEKLAEKVYGKSLDWFFRQWATLSNLPVLRLDRVTATQQRSGWRIRGHLLQAGDTLFRLPVPLLLRTAHRSERKEVWLKTREAQFEFQTADQPKRLLVDPDFEVLKLQRTAPHVTQFWEVYPTLLVIYGTQSEVAVNKAAAERFNNEYLGLDASRIKADTAVTEDDLKARCVCLFGRPKTNKIAQRFKDDFPIQVRDDQFEWQGTTYRRPTQGVVEAIEQPGKTNRLVVLYAGLGPEAMKAIGDTYLYDPDSSYVIFDGDKQLLSGDWEGADPDLVWDFPSEAAPPEP